MEEPPLERPVDAIRNAHRQDRLAPFVSILREVLGHGGSFEQLGGIDVLELGPNTRVEMMRFLETGVGVKSIRGVGRTVVWPWVPHRAFIRDHVVSCRFLPFFERDTPSRFDLIYSRHVMEKHYIHPWFFLTSAAYWARFKKNTCTHFIEFCHTPCPNIMPTLQWD